MNVKININHYVLVKLTDLGRNDMRRQHDDLMAHLRPRYQRPFVLKKEDENGYSKWQLHDLMHAFGPLIYLGGDVPFETEIILITKDGDSG